MVNVHVLEANRTVFLSFFWTSYHLTETILLRQGIRPNCYAWLEESACHVMNCALFRAFLSILLTRHHFLETILSRWSILSLLFARYMQCSRIRRRDGAVCSILTAERSLEAALLNLKMRLAILQLSMTGKHSFKPYWQSIFVDLNMFVK